MDADAGAEAWARRIHMLTHSGPGLLRPHTRRRAGRLLRPCLPELTAAGLIPP